MIDYLIRVWQAIKFEPTIIPYHNLATFWHNRFARRFLLPLFQLLLFLRYSFVMAFILFPIRALLIGYPAKELGDDISTVLGIFRLKVVRGWRPGRLEFHSSSS